MHQWKRAKPMFEQVKWLTAMPGDRIVVADSAGRRLEGFVEVIAPEDGVAWIREHVSGERMMITRGEYPRVVSS
ncbi:hypothetical protein [Arthrobacter rhombi]|uniref:hypothetical protein n=1 Tax=Arthrobacter rhombi TaxID=71253 RepID=UPI003FD4C4FA